MGGPAQRTDRVWTAPPIVWLLPTVEPAVKTPRDLAAVTPPETSPTPEPSSVKLARPTGGKGDRQDTATSEPSPDARWRQERPEIGAPINGRVGAADRAHLPQHDGGMRARSSVRRPDVVSVRRTPYGVRRSCRHPNNP